MVTEAPCYDNVNLTCQELREITESAKFMAVRHGGMLRHKTQTSLFHPMPFALFPSPIPRDLFEEVAELQHDVNILIRKASLDHEFIVDSLKSVIIHDEFTRKLFEIYQKVHDEGIKPRLCLLLVRSDYMLDRVSNNESTEGYSMQIKQIEVNTIAAGMGPLSKIASKMQSYVADELGDKSPFKKSQIADGDGIEKLGYGLAKSFQLYGNQQAILLIVSEVCEVEINRNDHKRVVYTFQKATKELGISHQVPVLFRTLEQITEQGRLTEDHKMFIGDKEVAVCYFRSAFRPFNFPNEQHWEFRLKIERSNAVKIPTIAEQLIGTKKIQQVFALPGVLERYIKNADRAKRLRATFAGLYSLDPGDEGDEAVKRAFSEPQRYVLKPQREGGGNNLFGDDIVTELNRITDPVERSQYILMERVRPPLQKNYMVHHDTIQPTLSDTVSEYGFFGVYLSDGGKEVLNESAGYLVRTKSVENDEGGVTCGSSVINSPYLVG